MAIEKVIPYARNPRDNAKAVAKVAASIKEFGFRQPIVVDAEMVVVAGHTRLEAARSLGMKKVPVHVAEGLSDQQTKAYRLADNRVAEEAVWDAELLGMELEELEAAEFDIELTGFDAGELEKYFADDTGDDKKLSRTVGDEKHLLIVELGSEAECETLYTELKGRGYECKLMS